MTTIQFPSIAGALLVLYDRGFRPQYAIDVGAYRGEFAIQFREIFPQCHIHMIDALESNREALRDVSDGRMSHQIALVSDVRGARLKFYEMATGSSVNEEASPYRRTSKILAADRLDGIVFQNVDFLKIDVQGHELNVLRGAGHLLNECQAVLVEVNMLPVNRGAPPAAEVIGFLSDRGFLLSDFCSQIRLRDGTLWQADLLFVRERLLPKASLTEENWCGP